ncbi:SAM-dependent methyltransferase [Dehalococcoidia bacterium]|nr:SAM-dependent methyltransferase [Dehalococcoidia bacterium]
MYEPIENKSKSHKKDMKNLTQISAQAIREKFGSTSYIYAEIKAKLESIWREVKDEQSIKTKTDNWASIIRTLYGHKPDVSMLIDHTYFNILTKVIVYLKFAGNKPDRIEIPEVINGKYFIDKGITNFLEEDFSLWLLCPQIEDKSFVIFDTIMDALTNYDFSEIDEDIFREIYEDIVERKERHKAGEYYTPEWLVQLILNSVFALWEEKKGGGTPKILDPACGSGTFLYYAIRHLIEKGTSLRDIIKSVSGIDINPVATIITKANYLIAISDLIEDEGITLPIYTKDCLKSPDLFDYDVKIEKYDIIIGNPPWVVMRSMKNREYQNFLKKEVLSYHLLENKDVHLFTQMELATLFFCKCADLYLKSEEIIAFVMPGSVLAGTIHHINFRKFRKPLIRLIKIIDLEEVTPLFNMPSCVLIGLKDGKTKYPVLSEKYMGELPDRNAKFSEAKEILSIKTCKYVPPDFSASAEPSYYYDKFRVGASIFPRSLCFVDIISRTNLQVFVKTSHEIYSIVKDPWKVVLEGEIEDDFLYATLLAWEIIPFGYIKLHPVVLPIKEESNRYQVLSTDELQRAGFVGIEKWLKEAQEIWHKRRTKKSEKRFPSLLDRLDYNNLLTIQNQFKRYVVLYNATGTNLVSCVIDKLLLPYFSAEGEKIRPKGFIADVKTWFFEAENEMEAYYLSAIFNSSIISEVIKPLQPRGLFGARAIHRRPLLFAIPKFDHNNDMHLRLADIGKSCHEKVIAMKIARKNNIRAEVRRKLKDAIVEINQTVSKVLNLNTNAGGE